MTILPVLCVCVSTRACMHVCVCVRARLCVYVRSCLCEYVCACMPLCVYVHYVCALCVYVFIHSNILLYHIYAHRWYMDVLGKACKDKEESCGDGKLNFAEISDILTIANQVAEHSRQGIYECVEFSI